MGSIAVQTGVFLGKGEILAPVFGAHAAGRIEGKILHMHFPDDVFLRQLRRLVRLPALRVGAAQVEHHAAHAVHAAGLGPGIGGTAAPAAGRDLIIIVKAVQTAGRFIAPQAALALLEHDLLNGFAAAALPVEVQTDGARSGRPEVEARSPGRTERTHGYVAVVVLFKSGGIKPSLLGPQIHRHLSQFCGKKPAAKYC